VNKSDKDQEIRALLSAYLDGELTQADRQRVRLYLESSEECRRELEDLARLKQWTRELQFPDPPDDLMEELERRLSVRGSRRLGWGLVVAGLLALALYGLVQCFARFRWPAGWLEWTAVLLMGGLALLFVSVLWQRLLERPYDRYRKVKR